jgi:hypothetical protein
MDTAGMAARELGRLSEALARAQREVAAAEVPAWSGPAAFRYDLRRRVLEGWIARLVRTADEAGPLVLAHCRATAGLAVGGGATVAPSVPR